MKFERLILFALALSLLNSCSTLKEPDKNLPFAKEVGLTRLEGKYRNKADGSVKSEAVYLSKLIFPNTDIKHDLINVVEVKKLSEDTLLAGACQSNKLVTSRKYKEGKDFKIEKGRIWLVKKSDFSYASPAGNPFIGYFSENQSIGIDEAGNGKLEQNVLVIGTAFVIIPVAGNDKEELRFNRVTQEKSCL